MYSRCAPASASHQFGFADPFDRSIIGEQVQYLVWRIMLKEFVEDIAKWMQGFRERAIGEYSCVEMACDRVTIRKGAKDRQEGGVRIFGC